MAKSVAACGWFKLSGLTGCHWVMMIVLAAIGVSGQDESQMEVKISPQRAVHTMEAGSSTTLFCEVTGNGDQRPDITWYLDELEQDVQDPTQRIHIERQSDAMLILNFAPVEVTDNYNAKCEASLGGDQPVSASIKLEAYEPVEFLSNRTQTGVLGEDGTVQCSASGSPNRVWRFVDRTRITDDDKYVIQGEKLTIRNLTHEDSLTYVCHLNDIRQGKSIPYEIDFLVVEPVIIPMAPTINPENPKQGEDVTLTCKAEGKPVPTYMFKKGGQPISESDMVEVDKENGVLTLKSVTPQSEGVYTCVASNPGGTAEREFKLDIKTPPEIISQPQTVEIKENEALMVNCTAKGDPAPTITWSKDGAVVDFTSEPQNGGPYIAQTTEDLNDTQEAESTLHFPAITVDDAGDYDCTASNFVGEARATFAISVKYAPHFNTTYDTTVFWGWSNHQANLTCMASANELATFTWYRPASPDNLDVSQATPISTDPPYAIQALQRFPELHLSSSSLLVTVTDEDDVFGPYLCEANNGKTAAQIVFLKQAVVPEQPLVEVLSQRQTTVGLKLTRPANDGGQRVTSYKYLYHKIGNMASKLSGIIEATGVEDVTIFELSSLDPSTNYELVMQAVNNVGEGSETTTAFMTTALRSPSAMEMTSGVHASSPDSYTVTWSPVDDGGSPVEKLTFTIQKVAVVDDSNEDMWNISSYLEDTAQIYEETTDPGATQFTITGLDADSYYELRMKATNRLGEGDETQHIIHTLEEEIEATTKVTEGEGDGKDLGAEEGDAEEKRENDAADDSSGSSAMIGITVGAIVLLLIIVVILILYLIARRRRGQAAMSGKSTDAAGAEDGKAQKEKLITNNDTVKTETETGAGEGATVKSGGEESAEDKNIDTKPDLKKDDAESIPLTAAVPDNPNVYSEIVTPPEADAQVPPADVSVPVEADSQATSNTVVA